MQKKTNIPKKTKEQPDYDEILKRLDNVIELVKGILDHIAPKSEDIFGGK